jgi:hypothetical protein
MSKKLQHKPVGVGFKPALILLFSIYLLTICLTLLIWGEDVTVPKAISPELGERISVIENTVKQLGERIDNIKWFITGSYAAIGMMILTMWITVNNTQRLMTKEIGDMKLRFIEQMEIMRADFNEQMEKHRRYTCDYQTNLTRSKSW